MADPKKNPLLGAFKAPDPPKEEKKPPAPTELPKDTKPPIPPAAPPKAIEEKKADDRDKGGKASAVSPKAGEEKKAADLSKTAEEKKPDGKAKEEKADKTSGKQDEEISLVSKIPISEIEWDTDIDESDPIFGLLVDDIALNGLKEPITLNKKPDGKYEVIDGNRRLAAMEKLGEAEIDALVANLPDKLKGKAQVASNITPFGLVTKGKPPIEGKKPADKGEKAKDGKDGEEKKPAEPPKATEDKKPDELPKETEELDEDGIPKDFSMEIVTKDKLGQVTMMATTYIDEFEGHPFPVRDDEDMAALVDSIKQVGILEPATIIRNPKKPGRFEMVAGHRRMHAAKLAGLAEIPVIVRDMDHDEATIYMVDSNLKRDKPLTPMEKARAYTMRAEALKRKTGRRSKAEIAAMEASGQKPMTADEEIAKQTGESVAQVQRLKTLTKLEKPLQDMVDKKQLPVNTAVDIAQMKPEEQKKLADAIEKEGGTVPSGTKAKELKEASKAGTLTEKKIEAAVAPTKREVEPPLKVTLMEEDLLPYFSKGTTVPDIKQGIFDGLKIRQKLMERQKAKAQEEKAGKKKPPAAPVR